MGTKLCSVCGGDLSVLTTYASQPGRCKECVKSRVRAHRAANLEQVQAYDRARASEPHRVEARKEYAKTEASKESCAAGSKKWAVINQEKRAAHIATGNAIATGRLIKAPCEVCGSSEVDAHHDDYSRPMEVRWLCKPHHAEHHKRLRDNARPDNRPTNRIRVSGA